VDQSKPLVLLSLNRFERKKNIALSIKALAAVLKKQREDKQSTNVQLYIAGGYDPRLAENVEHLEVRFPIKPLLYWDRKTRSFSHLTFRN
jgi:glycosyltransferase involved in cell wall biosynthesis